MGVWRLVLQILTRFLTKERKEEKKKKKKCYLHTKIHNRTIIMASYFQTRTLKSIPVLRPGLFWQKLCYHYLDQKANKKNSNPFGIRIFLFLSFSFGIETINTQTLRSSLETHTRFQTKTGQKPTSLCKHPFLLALRRWGRGETDVFAG